MVLGIVSLSLQKNAQTNRHPFKVFNRISRPVAIVDIVLGAVMAIVYTVILIVAAVAAAAAAANGANA